MAWSWSRHALVSMAGRAGPGRPSSDATLPIWVAGRPGCRLRARRFSLEMYFLARRCIRTSAMSIRFGHAVALFLVTASPCVGCGGGDSDTADLQTPVDLAADLISTSTLDGGCTDPDGIGCDRCLASGVTGIQRVQACDQSAACRLARQVLTCCFVQAGLDTASRLACARTFGTTSAEAFNLAYSYTEECGIACKTR